MLFRQLPYHMSVLFHPEFSFLSSRIQSYTMISKTFAVIHMGEMGEFVTDDVIYDSFGKGNKFSIEGNMFF